MNNFQQQQIEKRSHRKRLLQARRALPALEWQSRSQQLCQKLQTSSLFQTAHTVLAYFSFRQEPDLSSLFHLEKVWGFPRCVELELCWHHWSPQSPLALQVGTYGIQEPHPEAALIAPEEVDLLLVPAVACDRRGYRLGYGGGFYDRLLSNPVWQNICAIAIVFDFALVDDLPIEPWDQPMQGVCTDQQLVWF